MAIGEVARRSGLTVSALRYYDEAGVLVPIVVDPASGYRFYGPTQVRLARLVARLRRVGLPVVVLRQVVNDPHAAGPLLDAHLCRLEHALTDARRELFAARALLEEEPTMPTTITTTVTTTRTALATALRAVRFAVGSDPELPAINGVLLDATASGPRLVATDRYRLAVAPLEADIEGPDARAILPCVWVDDLLRRLGEPGERPDVVVEVSGEKVTASVDGTASAVARPALDYPDYRRLVRDRGPGVVVQPTSLRAGLEAAPTMDHAGGGDGVARRVALLARDGDDITVLSQPGQGAVAFDREFLLEAVEAANGTPLTLALDGPPEPLVIRTPDGGVSLLMPVPLT